MFENIKIEKDIPIPESAKIETELWKHLAENIKVGDSVFLKAPPRNPILSNPSISQSMHHRINKENHQKKINPSSYPF